MNKKVLTLCAGFLLAGSLTATAQETNWIPVSADQLVNGAEYVIHNGEGDSILVNGNSGTGMTYVSGGGTNYAAPRFYLNTRAGRNDSIWVMTKTGPTFTLKASNGNEIRLVGSELYSNVADATDQASFTLNADSTLSVKGINGAFAKNWKGNGIKVNATKENATKFVFYMQQTPIANTDLPNGTKELAAVEGAVYVVDGDGNYIGVDTKKVELQTRAVAGGNLVATSATEFLDLDDEAKKAYVWVAENGGLKSAYAAESIYLNVNKNGAFTTSTTPVEATIENNVFSANGYNAQISFVTSEIQKPFKGDFWHADLENDTQIVLYAGDQYSAIDADGNVVSYDPQEAVPTVWNIVKHEKAQAGKFELRLEDQDGNPLKVGGYYVTIAEESVNWSDKNSDGTDDKYTITNPVLLTANGQYVGLVDGALKLVDIYQATEFGLGDIQNAYMTANSLIDRFGDYFTLKITYKDEKNKTIDITGKFKGQLRPVRNVYYSDGNTDYVDATTETSFMLVNEEGNIIAINTKEPLHTGGKNYGYAFTTITPKEWDEAVDKAAAGKEDNPYLVQFKLEYIPGTEQSDVTSEISNMIVYGTVGSENYYLYVGRQEDSKDDKLVAAESQDLLSVNFELNAGSLVDAKEWLTKPAYYTIEVINKSKVNAVHFEKVLGLGEYGSVAWVDEENIDLTKPEGQFAITYNDEEDYYAVTNRENKAYTTFFNDGALYQIDATTFAFVTSAGTDTLAIKPVTDYKSEDGFKRYTAAELNANTYNIAMNLLDDSYLNVVENHNDKHRIGLDREETTEWRIEMPTVMLQDDGEDDIRLIPDTVTVETKITYYVGAPVNDWVTTTASDYEDEYYAPNTALKIPAYILKNTDTNEYLYGKNYTESEGNAYYVCEESEKDATRVAFKLIGGSKDSTVNIVPVYRYVPAGIDNWETSLMKEKAMKEDAYKAYASQLRLDNMKIIGGTTSKTGVLKDAELYEATSNDLFVINEAAAPTYKKVDQGSNIILSRVKNNDEVIYEAGEFAGISNRVAYTDINPTLYVDSAYVDRAGNYAYQYLLMVQPNLSNEWYCPYNNEHNTEAWREENGVDHCADAVRTDRIDGRFLVNMVDSAEANKDVHNNKFAYNGETKLAFVDGFHQNDTLYFTNEAGDITSKVAVGNPDFNFAKFAFKMIDETDNEFVIETGLNYEEKYNWVLDNNKEYFWQKVTSKEVTPGYLRWVNGNLVVTQNLDEAERFTMENSELNATANEEISAENAAVSVVATDGAVIIKGAEGKNVVIATILGKVVANETVNSDNETIAVPAGIAVVSVDGESFKVVVK